MKLPEIRQKINNTLFNKVNVENLKKDFTYSIERTFFEQRKKWVRCDINPLFKQLLPPLTLLLYFSLSLLTNLQSPLLFFFFASPFINLPIIPLSFALFDRTQEHINCNKSLCYKVATFFSNGLFNVCISIQCVLVKVTLLSRFCVRPEDG